MYNVLIVDDEPLICKGLSRLLESSGLDIGSMFTAHSGQEALDYIRMEEIDLLVTDIQMGEMNGIELMHQARLVKPWVQAIVISAHETFQYAQMAIKLGARDYLIKPLKSEQFLDSVRSVLLKIDKTAAAGDGLLSGLREHFRMEQPAGSRIERLNRLLEDGVQPPGDDELGLRGPYFAVLRIRLELSALELPDRDGPLLQYAALNIASELLGEQWTHHAFYAGGGDIGIVVEWDEAAFGESGADKIQQLDMIGRSLHFNIGQYLRIPCVIGFSQILKGAEFLPALGGQAARAIRWNREHRDHHVFYYGDFHWSRYEQGDPSEEELAARNNAIVGKAKEYIDANYAQKGLTLQEVAQRNHVSPNYLSYLFKKSAGINLWEYVIKLRMEESRRLLLHSDLRRYEIADRVGYESPEHFSKIFKKYYGISPSELKK